MKTVWKIVNSMKNRSFDGLNLNIIVEEKNAR